MGQDHYWSLVDRDGLYLLSCISLSSNRLLDTPRANLVQKGRALSHALGSADHCIWPVAEEPLPAQPTNSGSHIQGSSHEGIRTWWEVLAAACGLRKPLQRQSTSSKLTE